MTSVLFSMMKPRRNCGINMQSSLRATTVSFSGAAMRPEPPGRFPAGTSKKAKQRWPPPPRELQEETGAISFDIHPVCWYSAYRATGVPHSLGLLCIAEVHALGELHSEIAEVRTFVSPPDALTYPQIQPFLLAEAQRRGIL